MRGSLAAVCRLCPGSGLLPGSFVRFRCSCAVQCCAYSIFLVVAGSVSGVVAFAGSRSLPSAFAPLVASVVGSVVRSGRSVSVGCCIGVDQVVLSCVPTNSVRCFAAFGAGGVGACSLSAVSAVSDLAAAGGSVSWWSGGGSSVALPVRLSFRTHAVINAATVSALVFFTSPWSAGSVLACHLAVGRGLPVFAFPCGFPGFALPLLGLGAWVAVGGGVWSSAFRWVPAQVSLF